MNPPDFERIREILAGLLDVPRVDITLETSPDTVETWDSLKHLDLVLALEQELAVRFTPQEIAEMRSVERIATIVARKRLPPG